MMQDELRPTIAAVATAVGTGAVSLIRLSGPRAVEIADVATQGRASKARERMATMADIFDAHGDSIDQGLLTVFRGTRSYTGEDTVEFTGHGGRLVTRQCLARLLECGAEAAGPGEFTQRAFLNGKLDLTQAEAVMDLISAQSTLALRAAREQLDGLIGQRILTARDAVLGVLAHAEAYIDFPDEDISPETGAALCNRVGGVIADLDKLLATADQGRVLREGVRTVICGAPNVGKSSLLNRLLGFERAIVSDIAGTTRDTIEETIVMDGIPLRLVDTAGVRESDDHIEAEGIRRTQRQIEAADLLIEVVDASQPLTRLEPQDGTAHVLVLNKCDLPMHPSWQGHGGVAVACSDGRGFDLLGDAIRDALHFGNADWGDHAVAINARHQACLQRARTALIAALAALEDDMPAVELISVDLRDALDALGDVIGKVDTEDLLGVIFSTFCIGK